MQNNVNILSKVTSALLKTEVSKKTNNPYTYVEWNFDGGYSMRQFLSSEQKYILSSLSNSQSFKIPVKQVDDELPDSFLDD